LVRRPNSQSSLHHPQIAAFHGRPTSLSTPSATTCRCRNSWCREFKIPAAAIAAGHSSVLGELPSPSSLPSSIPLAQRRVSYPPNRSSTSEAASACLRRILAICSVPSRRRPTPVSSSFPVLWVCSG
jgi:hypothetical protein